MQKYLLLLSIIITSTGIQSQSVQPTRKRQADKLQARISEQKNRIPHVQAFEEYTGGGHNQNSKTDVLKQRLTANRIDNYTAGVLETVDSNTWTYSGNRGSVSAGNSLFDTRNRWVLSNGNIVPDYRRTRTWDVNGRNTEFLEEDNVSGTFESDTRILYTYDVKGNMLSATTQNWDAGSWKNSSKTDYTYDANNETLSQTLSSWNGSAWEITQRYAYAYDNQNRMVEYVFQQDNGSGLENISRYASTYDANGDVATNLNQDWVGGAWVNDTRFVFTYNNQRQQTCSDLQDWESGAWVTDNKYEYVYANGLLMNDAWTAWRANIWDTISRRYYIYNGTQQLIEDTSHLYINNIPQNSYRTTYTYDVNGNYDVLTYFKWGSNTWQNDKRTNFDYDLTYNNLLRSFREEWNVSAWRTDDYSRYYYGTYDAPSTVAEIADALRFTVYPNPASNFLNIDFNTSIPGESSLRIFNINGQEVQHAVIPSAIGDNYLKLDIGNLSSGLYIAELRNGHTFSRARFCKL